MSEKPSISVLELRLSQQRSDLSVTFSDGRHAIFSTEFLRVMSPSAEVQGHSPSERKLVSGKRHVTVKTIEPIGNYAVRLIFSDGHNSGLYSWDFLYKAASEKDALWQSYLDELAERGLSRDK